MKQPKAIREFAPLAPSELTLREALRKDVSTLAEEIGERNLFQYRKLCDCADFLEAALQQTGLTPQRQMYRVDNKPCYNLDASVPGTDRPEEIVVIGAHYDTVLDCPGANDNGTGVAAMLALARAFVQAQPARTLRFVAFVNEEPPYFQTPLMGSYVYAKSCRERDENIVAMLSLETIGYYTDAPKSQDYPFPLGAFFPPTGNFIAMVSNRRSAAMLKKITSAFRAHSDFPVVDGAFPGVIPGIGWSDQWAFWQHDYPGMMVTDTAPFRYPFYHTPEDTPDKIHFDHFTRLVVGLQKAITTIYDTSKQR